VSRKFVVGLKALDEPSVVTVVASRTRANAERFARDLGVPRATDNYAAAVAADDVDVVYVATPPSEHETHALLAIEHDKPVLVEKPFAIDAAAAARIAAAARAAEVFCMEAMWTRFMPLVIEIKRRVDAGSLGELRAFDASFRAAEVPDVGQSQFDANRGGGALMHRGVYGVSMARHVLGPVAGVDATARLGVTGVDEDVAAVLRHESGALSTVTASLRTSGGHGFTILGTEGRIDVRGPIYRPVSARMVAFSPRRGGGLQGSGGLLRTISEFDVAQRVRQRADGLVTMLRGPRSKRLNHPYRGNGYHYEALEVIAASARRQQESSVMPLNESIEVMAVIDAARKMWSASAR